MHKQQQTRWQEQARSHQQGAHAQGAHADYTSMHQQVGKEEKKAVGTDQKAILATKPHPATNQRARISDI